ncbi:MAG: flagellar biosynthesis anti-sigma factor FlgM [Polyangiales bacterium]
MKISGIQRPYIDTTTTARRGAPSGASASPAAKVAVSSEAKSLAEARAPEIADTGKVQRLSLAIANGEFAVDAEQVADRMLAEEQ